MWQDIWKVEVMLIWTVCQNRLLTSPHPHKVSTMTMLLELFYWTSCFYVLCLPGLLYLLFLFQPASVKPVHFYKHLFLFIHRAVCLLCCIKILFLDLLWYNIKHLEATGVVIWGCINKIELPIRVRSNQPPKKARLFMSYVILSLIYSQRLSGPHSVHLASLSLSNIICLIMFPEQVILFSSQFQGLSHEFMFRIWIKR